MTARNPLAHFSSAALLPLVLLLAGCGRAAQAGSATSPPAAAPAVEPGNPAMGHEIAGMEPGATESMSHEHMMGPHMRMTAPRPVTTADRERAAALVATLRTSLAKYKDYRVAVAEGYKQFLPRVWDMGYTQTSTPFGGRFRPIGWGWRPSRYSKTPPAGESKRFLLSRKRSSMRLKHKT